MRRHATFLKYNQDGVFSLIVYSLLVTLIHTTLRNANKNDSSSLCLLKKTLWSLFMDGVQLPQGESHFEEAVYFLPLSPQKFSSALNNHSNKEMMSS